MGTKIIIKSNNVTPFGGIYCFLFIFIVRVAISIISFPKMGKRSDILKLSIYLCNFRNCYGYNKIEDMKFYNRKSELAELQRIQNLSFSDHSRLTVVTGRRRIGI